MRAKLSFVLVAIALVACGPFPEYGALRAPQDLLDENLLVVPEGDGPYPLVLLMGTCWGNLGHVDQWAYRLRDWGYAALVINSVRARRLDNAYGREQICAGRTLPAEERVRDVVASAADVASAARVDPSRMAIIGLSHGGWTALELLRLSTGDMSDGVDRGVKAGLLGVVAVYPYCSDEMLTHLDKWPRDVQVLMLLAGDDQTVGYEVCSTLAMRQRQSGRSVTSHVYPGAAHGYDIDPEFIHGITVRHNVAADADTTLRVQAFLEAVLLRPR